MIQTLLASPEATSFVDELTYFNSADEFRPISAVRAGFTIPLGAASHGAARAVCKLPTTTVLLQRTFPRMMEAHFVEAGAMVVVPLEAPDGFVANGEFCDDRVVLVLRGSGRAHFVEKRGNLFGIVSFGAELPVDRWHMKDDAMSFVRLPPARLSDLRAGLLEVARAHKATAGTGPETALFDRFERAIQAGDIVGGDTEAVRTRYIHIVEHVDRLLVERRTQSISNEDVAREVGMSSRTVRDALNMVRGMSLHRYLRLLRLWSVRKQLIASTGQAQIALIAAANGFRHMGEFAAAYRAAFGELPSLTAARSRTAG